MNRLNLNNPFHVKEYTFTELRNLVERYFNEVEYYSLEEVKLHKGVSKSSTVMIAVGRKENSWEISRKILAYLKAGNNSSSSAFNECKNWLKNSTQTLRFFLLTIILSLMIFNLYSREIVSSYDFRTASMNNSHRYLTVSYHFEGTDLCTLSIFKNYQRQLTPAISAVHFETSFAET